MIAVALMILDKSGVGQLLGSGRLRRNGRHRVSPAELV